MKKLLLSILLVISLSANAQFWIEKATGFTSPKRILNSIAIVDANVIWATAIDNFLPLEPDYTIKEFTKSTDGGNTWIPGTIDLGANSADLGISSITAISSTTAWVSAYPDVSGTTQLGGIWKTIDGGLNWTKQTTALFNDASSFTNFVYFWDANNGIAQGDPVSNEFEIYTTNDGGTTWTQVPAANIPDPTSIDGEFAIFNSYASSENTFWFGTDNGRLFKSIDKGLNWTAVQSQSTDFTFDKFTFSDANKGLLTTYTTPILLYKTMDGGANWSPVATTMQNTDLIYIPGTSTVVAADRNNPLGSSYSTNDGVTWTTIDGLPHGTLAFLNNSVGFSSGENSSSTVGGIFKFTGIPLKAPSFDLKNQITAYPNPTNGILHLNSESSLIKEVSVFDLLGRNVHSAKFSAINKVDLDLKSLQAGTYVLKVTTDSGKTETMKIMKK